MEPVQMFIYGVACACHAFDRRMRGTEDLLSMVTAAGFRAADGRPYRPGRIGNPWSGDTGHGIFPLIRSTYHAVELELGDAEAAKVAYAFTDKQRRHAFALEDGVVG